MVTRPIRLRDVQAITFDCYGTLIDWEGGAKRTLAELLRQKETGAEHPFRTEDLDQFFQDWEREQKQRIQEAYAPYRQIAAESFLAVARSLTLPLTEADARGFAEAIPRWPPFPDTVAALTALGEQVRLGIISNIDDALLAGSVAQLGTDFAVQVTAEQARAYKPARRPFELALARLALPAHLVAHAAFGFDYDITTASALGFRTILVRRGRVDFPAQPVPDVIAADLAELASAFAGV
ncbi:MAG: haloacid dehalogenase type II [Acidobacteria bacterium]|nr:haloacid dehalogenase type II [Acidobacteriota bacterium]